MIRKTLIINGVTRQLILDQDETLAKVLREHLLLTGCKIGCGEGHCGACNVIMNGKVTKSCVVKMSRVPDNAEITTIEGVGTLSDMHPLQVAWMAHGCAQCGFCTPGFIISALMPGSMLLRSLMAHFRRWYHFRPYAQPEQRSASLRGGMDGWLSRRSGNFRCKMKKARRRAQEQGIAYERHIPSSPDEANALYARMLDVESRSWKGAANSGISETPSREFYHAMMHRLAVGPQAGCARVMFATHEGRDIGFIFGSLSGGNLTARPVLFSPWGMPVSSAHRADPRNSVYRGQQFSYDQEWREFSVGDLLQFQQMEWLCEEGVARYDMGMSDDPRMAYKSHWAETVRQQETWIMLPKSSCSLIV